LHVSIHLANEEQELFSGLVALHNFQTTFRPGVVRDNTGAFFGEMTNAVVSIGSN
jgi:hypothetical protein